MIFSNKFGFILETSLFLYKSKSKSNNEWMNQCFCHQCGGAESAEKFCKIIKIFWKKINLFAILSSLRQLFEVFTKKIFTITKRSSLQINQLLNYKVAGVKVYPRWNQNNRTHAVTACIGEWHYGAMPAVHTYIGLWFHRPMHALTAWDIKFQVCLRYTFTSATLVKLWHQAIDI